MRLLKHLNEAVKIDKIAYTNWKKEHDEIEKLVNSTNTILQKFTKDSSGGCSDEVRNSTAFKKAKNNFNIAFKKSQNFAKKAPKGFLKQISMDHRASWRNK